MSPPSNASSHSDAGSGRHSAPQTVFGTPGNIIASPGFYSPAHTPFGVHASPTSEPRESAECEPEFRSQESTSYTGDNTLLKEEDIALLRSSTYSSNDNYGVFQDFSGRAVDGSWDEAYILLDYRGNYAQTPSNRPFPSPPLSEHSMHHLPPDSPTTGPVGKGAQSLKGTRPSRGRRTRRAAGEKAEKPKVPKLTLPLSELTQDYHHLPFRNMENWVHRTAEVRRAEAEKRGGYVTRPMNSFMLYRSAFAERTKFWCLQNNHQVVSSVSGVSWPLEPPHVREKYNELARIERANHQAAHPGYKFSPSKAQRGIKRTGQRTGGDTESVVSDVDGPQSSTQIGPGSPATKPRKIFRPVKNNPKSASSPLIYLGYPYEKPDGGPLRSSFHHNNPGKAPPKCMGTNDMNGQYYQTTVRASSVTPIPNPMPSAVIEDITIRKTQAPTNSRSNASPRSLHDPPFGNNYGHQFQDPRSDFESLKVDPAILGDSNGTDQRIYWQAGTTIPDNNYFTSHGMSGFMMDHERASKGSTHASNAATPNSSFVNSDYSDHYLGQHPQYNPFDARPFMDHNNSDMHKLPHTSDPTMQSYLDGIDSGWNTPEISAPEDEKLSFDEWLAQ